MTAGKKSRRYELEPERYLDIPGLRVIESVNDRFSATVDYCNFHLPKNFSRCEGGVADELYRKPKKTAEQMKDRNFSGKNTFR